MSSATADRKTSPRLGVDLPTLAALTILAYVGETIAHEVIGHGVACLAVGADLTELGAFYVNCDGPALGNVAKEIVVLAGPAMSLLTGIACFFVLSRLGDHRPHARYLAWLTGTVGLMTFAGYLLFSGVTGLGDFGTSADGAFEGVSGEPIIRVVLAVVGAGGYYLVCRFTTHALHRIIGGEGPTMVARAQWLARTSYFMAGAVMVAVGFLNPEGVVIVVTSAAASTLGGTSGLAWMIDAFMTRDVASPSSMLTLGRSMPWLISGGIVLVTWAVVLGPTIHP